MQTVLSHSLSYCCFFRFCGISNSFVKRNFEGSSVNTAVTQSKSSGHTGLSKITCAPQKTAAEIPQQIKVQQSSPNVNLKSPNVPRDVKSENNGTGTHFQITKPPADQEKAIQSGVGKKKGQSDRNSSETGSSLANLWGRASAKSKASCAPTDSKDKTSNPTGLYSRLDFLFLYLTLFKLYDALKLWDQLFILKFMK